MSMRGKRNHHFQVICEAIVPNEVLRGVVGKGEVDVVGRNRTDGVVEGPKFIQLPEGVVLNDPRR